VSRIACMTPPITKRFGHGRSAIPAGPSPSRRTFPFTPTSGSWLTAVEGFFATLTRRRLKHGVFCSVVDLQAAINSFAAERNSDGARPFVWRADPDAIIASWSRGFQALEPIQ
jgi:hypothetical protein